jgi:hypothetical protein
MASVHDARVRRDARHALLARVGSALIKALAVAEAPW